MLTQTINPAKRFSIWLVCLAALFLCAFSNAYAQQSTGSISGLVLDTTSGKYLEGAEVTAVPSSGEHSFRATTERGGGYSLVKLAPDTYTITATYPGLEPKTVSAIVTAGESLDVPISLVSDTIMLETLKVSSSKEGMAQAQALQKISIPFKLVAADDQFGPISEGNVGEYLKFLPGVSIDYNVNDARGISLRGLSTAFTIVAVDGTPMASGSSTDDTRRFEVEQIAMNNVESTEIYKTVTPDIPASATGGYTNFVTKSAFDRSTTQEFAYDFYLAAPMGNLHFTRQDGVWGTKAQYTFRPNLTLNFSRKITPKLGFNINYRFSEKYDSSPRVEYTWNTTKVGNTANSIFSGAPLLQQYNIRNEQKLTHREALAAKVDYKIAEKTKLSIAGQWNWYDLHFTQRGPQFVLNGSSGTSSRSGDTFSNATTMGGNTATSGSQIQNGALQRRKYGTTYAFNGTLTHSFSNNSKLEITPYWSQADSQYRDVNEGYISTTAVMSPSDTTYRTFEVSNALDLGTLATISLFDKDHKPISLDQLRSLANYTLSNTSTGSNFQSRQWTAKETKKGINGSYKYDIDMSMPLSLQGGFAFDRADRNIDRPDQRAVISSITGYNLASYMDTGFNRDVGYGFGSMQVINPSKILSLYPSNIPTYSIAKRDIEEKNDAVYLRGDFKPIKDLLIVGGVRWEKHTIDAYARTGVVIPYDRSRPTEVNLDYDNFYPSVNVKYTPTKNIVARLGYSYTVGHPDFGEILPSVTGPSAENGTNGSITVPADGLKPYYVNNYDAAIEYYIKNSGVVGVAVFRKDVSGFIYNRAMTSPELDSYVQEYGLIRSEYSSGAIRDNGADSTLEGIELRYQQNLTFIPASWGSFNVQMNYTKINVSASDSDKSRELDTYYSQLRAVTPKTFNFILGHRYRSLSSTLSVNWVSESLYGGFVNTDYFVGTANYANPALDTRLTRNKDEKTTVDLKFEYSFNKHISMYVRLGDLFNAPRKEYFAGYLPQYKDNVLPLRYFEFGGPQLNIGVRGKF